MKRYDQWDQVSPVTDMKDGRYVLYDEAKAKIKKLEKLLAEGMNVIPINKNVLKNPTDLLNWKTKVTAYFKHKEEVE